MAIVFVVHNGKQKYLRYCIEVAEKYGNDIYLIGNEKSIAIKPEKFISDDMEMPLFNEFLKRYVHLSPSLENFEILCFKRYFQLLYVTENYNEESFWLIDSDVLLLYNLNNFESELKIRFYDNALWTPKQSEYAWLSSAGISYWTVKSLQSFVSFIISTYSENLPKLQEKWSNHLSTNTPGGICDMTLLYLWSKKRESKTYNIYNSFMDFEIIDDNNITLNNNVKILNSTESPAIVTIPFANIKKVFFINNKYYIRTKSDLKYYPVRSLHFQGNSKVFMRYFGNERTIGVSALLLPIAIQFIKFIRSKLKLRSMIQKYLK